MVVERARAEAPADFAEDVSDNPDQAHLNVHVLRSMILRSLEHLQRVALGEWVERNSEVRAVEVPEPMERGPDPSNDGFEGRLHTLDLAAAQLAATLEVDLGSVRPAGPDLDTPASSTDGDLETGKEILGIEPIRQEPSLPAPSPLFDDSDATIVDVAPVAAVLPDPAQSRATETTVMKETPAGAFPQSDGEVSPSVGGDLETELKEALNVQLALREPDAAIASSGEQPSDRLVPEDRAAPLLEATLNTGGITVAGEMQQLEPASPPSQAEPPQPKGTPPSRFRFWRK